MFAGFASGLKSTEVTTPSSWRRLPQEYKDKLQAALDRVRAEHQEAEKLEIDIREERTSWKDQI